MGPLIGCLEKNLKSDSLYVTGLNLSLVLLLPKRVAAIKQIRTNCSEN